MSLVGLVQLAQGIFNQTLDENSQGQQTTAKNKPANETANAPQTNADSFVPSAQNPAHDAGTFQVQQVSLFSAAATILLRQNPAPPPTAATPAAPAPQNAVAQNNAAITLPNSNAAAATAVTAPDVAPVAAPAATAPTASNATAALSDLSNLNASLTVLGLSLSEIAAIDRVAQLIKDFNPTAFTDLINQFQTLAQSNAPPPAAPANSTATNAAGAAATPAATATTPAIVAAPATNVTR